MTSAYSIRDLERITGVARTTIHFYLRQGLLPRAQKTAASRSLYTGEHVDMLIRIKTLQAQGHSLAEIEREIQPRLDEANDAAIDLATQERRRVRDRIVAVAAREFAAKGYTNTHVAQIMRTSGTTASVFYGHFPSKRRLLTECVTLLMERSGASAGAKQPEPDDPAEAMIMDLSAHQQAFDLASAALAVVRLEGDDEDPTAQTAMEGSLAAEVRRIAALLDSGQASAEHPSAFPGELVALELFRSYLPLALSPLSDEHGPDAALRARLWLFLAAQAARNGEVDIDSRLERYGALIAELAAAEPSLPEVAGETG
jgi:DNA-binding transcriptional MerR regulator